MRGGTCVLQPRLEDEARIQTENLVLYVLTQAAVPAGKTVINEGDNEFAANLAKMDFKLLMDFVKLFVGDPTSTGKLKDKSSNSDVQSIRQFSFIAISRTICEEFTKHSVLSKDHADHDKPNNDCREYVDSGIKQIQNRTIEWLRAQINKVISNEKEKEMLLQRLEQVSLPLSCDKARNKLHDSVAEQLNTRKFKPEPDDKTSQSYFGLLKRTTYNFCGLAFKAVEKRTAAASA